ASERRTRGGPAGSLSTPFAEAGFAAAEWLPDRTDDLAIRLLVAGARETIPQPERLDALSVLLRATLARTPPAPDELVRTLQRLGLDLAVADGPALLEGARP